MEQQQIKRGRGRLRKVQPQQQEEVYDKSKEESTTQDATEETQEMAVQPEKKVDETSSPSVAQEQQTQSAPTHRAIVYSFNPMFGG